MSKQRASKAEPAAAGRAPVPDSEFWSSRLFKNTYTRAGRRLQRENWSVKIQYLGRRSTFALSTADRSTAALEAKALYETIVAQGWDAALNHEKSEPGFPKTDARFWKEQLLVRRYRFPASGEPAQSFTARIGHAGNESFFPMGTADIPAAARMACRIYCAIVKHGWEEACARFPRELIVAFEWSANPILWTYTTVHTLVGRLDAIETGAAPVPAASDPVAVVETEPGLRRALAWCLNHQPGFHAVPCESPEQYVTVAGAHQPKLVLLNRSLAERMGVAFAGGLTVLSSGVRALTYSVSLDGDHMFVSTPGGAEGYMLKRVPPANILDPLLEAGKLAVTPAEDPLVPVKTFFKGLLRPRATQHSDALSKLTPRENEVLLLLSKGCVDKEIAQAMAISVWTVHGHIKKIFERLGVRTRTEAVIRYLEK